MNDLVTSSFREDDPAGLARSLLVMAASIPANGTVTVTLTPAAARWVARSIEAGIAIEKVVAETRKRIECATVQLEDMTNKMRAVAQRSRRNFHFALFLFAASFAVSLAVPLVLP